MQIKNRGQTDYGRLRSLLGDMWSSVVRHGRPDSDRNRSEVMNWNLILHLLPVRVHKHTLRFSATLGLGIVSLYLFLILCISGVVLMFYYVPSTGEAYGRMKDLAFVVSYGRVLRNLHRWAAHGMVFCVFLHMCRVFYTASYRRPREFNWVLGVLLLVLTLGLSFTGYLLPWDQLAYWAITVGSSIAGYAPLIGSKLKFVLLGGNKVGQEALIRFYVFHCVLLPASLLGLLALHFWRVRKDGGLCRPVGAEAESGPDMSSEPFRDPDKTYGLMAVVRGNALTARTRTPDDTLPSWPHLVYRLVVLWIAVCAVLLIVSIYFNAPLSEIANPELPENPAKAPWYFLGLQEMVSYSALAGGILVPALAILWLMSIPFLDRQTGEEGLWLADPQDRTAAGWSAAAGLVGSLGILAVAIRTGGLRGILTTAPQFLLDVLNPATFLAGIMALFAAFEWRRTRSVRGAMIVMFTGFVITIALLTVVGVYLRGPNWKFHWFWQEWSPH